MALPLTGITTSLVSSAIGVSSSDIGTLCSSPNVNKWSKRKPIVDTVLVKNSGNYWRTSSIDDRIRNGFWVENNLAEPFYYNILWDYKRTYSGCRYRLGDFRGYDASANGGIIRVIMPNSFTLGSSYTATVIARGYTTIGEGSDTIGATGLHDVFNLDTKYCCVGVYLENLTAGRTIEKYSARIDASPSLLYGGEVVFTASEISTLIGAGGIIAARIFMIEADSYNGTIFTNAKKWSLKSEDNVVTYIENRQYLASGFSFMTNYFPQTPTKSGTRITSTANTFVVVASADKSGGLISGYYFRARILNNNQLGTNYTYQLPNYTIGSNTNYTYYIPSFYLEALNGNKVEVEYSTWDGLPDSQDAKMIESNIFVLE